ncbi:MAG TPA: glycoside hydrolase family 15 protein [Steroidobacteraceae bacterium]|jgi:glucoamylase|nr:glycoside hydrolase family 15 protein [Steroidobacteraceae bacterium]
MTRPVDANLSAWVESQYAHCAHAMLRSVSAVDLVKDRPGFGHRIRASKGSVIASPVLGSYDPDPDYFFHWLRDSAVVMDALRLLYEDGQVSDSALMQFDDFITFSLELGKLDGRTLVRDRSWRNQVAADFEKFLRADVDLETALGDAVAGETRFNPDGTLDISKWGRPQNDGPPLRVLTLLRWFDSVSFEEGLDERAATLLRADLHYTQRYWRDPSYDIWEEEKGLHYYTLSVSAAALEKGADWLENRGDEVTAGSARVQARIIRELLDNFWASEDGYYRSRVLEGGARSTKELDIAVILAAIHAPGDTPRHSVRDPRMQDTLRALERLFTADYPINQALPVHRAPAMGRYHGDVYYSGGAYYFSTLGAAEFCFLAAAHGEPREWLARGNAYLETVRTYTPADGELSEQFDQKNGTQTSARQLAWSYAAFISCTNARRTAMNMENQV